MNVFKFVSLKTSIDFFLILPKKTNFIKIWILYEKDLYYSDSMRDNGFSIRFLWC